MTEASKHEPAPSLANKDTLQREQPSPAGTSEGKNKSSGSSEEQPSQNTGNDRKPSKDSAEQSADKQSQGRKPLPLWLVGAGLAVALAVSLLLPGSSAPTTGEEVDYSEVLSAASQTTTQSVTIDENTNTISITAKDGEQTWSHYPAGAGKDLASDFQDQGAEVKITPVTRPGVASTLLLTLLPVALIIGFLYLLMRRGGGLGLGGLKLGKRNNPVEVPSTRFSDIAGAQEAVDELQEVVDFLHQPEKFTRTGAKPPRGFLLVGPPGTGKTLLARAVAGEAEVPFFALNGSDFVEMFVGVGAARVRELFEKARAAEKAIIFIDEIDAVGKARSKGVATGANDERESTLNQLLVEMDGFARTPGLVMIAATNRPDVLDPALLRPGRFDRKIHVAAPDKTGRLALLELYSKGRPFSDVDWVSVARRIPGMTGADIEQMLNEAALEAARRNQDVITTEHVEAALATSVLGRERKSAVITERDRKIVAWHEAGHTVASLMQPHADNPVSVTIVPRGGAGGVTWLGGNDHDFMTRTQARARLVVAMAGRAAEELLLDGDHTQGAHGDLSSATGLATEMITRYGMGARLAAIDPDRVSLNQNHDIDGEVSDMLHDALETARGVLSTHAHLLERIATELLEKETLDLEQLTQLAEEEGVSLPAKLHSSD